MTPYPHPAAALAVFQQRLSLDMNVDNSSYVLLCGAPSPLDASASGGDCDDWSKRYNSQVDLRATGALIGDVTGYYYNRLDIAKLALPKRTFEPYLTAGAITTHELIDEFNARSGLSLDPSDVADIPLPHCDCACGPVGIDWVINADSLLFIGRLTLYVITHDVPLNVAVINPFLPAPVLPALTP